MCLTAEFSRGDVFYVNLPEVPYDPGNEDHVKGNPRPHTVLQGMHMCIVMTDKKEHNGKRLSDQHVVVVPISRCKSAEANDRLLATHVLLKPSNNSFLKQTSYALAFQPIPIPIHWLREEKRRGKVDPDDLGDISVLLLVSMGSTKHVQALIDAAVESKLQEYIEQLESIQDEGNVSSDE